MKKLAALGLVGIVLAPVVTVAAWASIADAPWEKSSTTSETTSPTPLPPAFTEEEVLSLVGRMAGRATAEVECFDADFKPQNRMWVVNCTVDYQYDSPETMLFTFDDQTGQLGD